MLLIALVLGGCSAPVVEYVVVPAPDAGVEAGVCVCDFRWLNVTAPDAAPIRCYPRGECTGAEVCVPVEPLAAEPTCRFR